MVLVEIGLVSGDIKEIDLDNCYGFTIFCYEYNYLDNNNGGLSKESNNN